MVSHRCKLTVKEQLNHLDIPYQAIHLGMVELLTELNSSERDQLNQNLIKSGLELLIDQKLIMVENIKNVIVEMIHHSHDRPPFNYSDHIAAKLGYNYNYLGIIFREEAGVTIQQYIILHKIEKVKELILYDELNLGQIADKMGYSSIAHLSSQFKKNTGRSPSDFKKNSTKRKNLEDL